MKKRLISGIVSAAIFVSSALSTDCFNAFMNYGRTDDTPKTTEYGFVGDNSLGKYFEKMSQDNTINPEVSRNGMLSASAAEGGFSVTNLSYDEQTGKLRAVSTQPCECKLVFKFVKDGEKEPAYTLETVVQAGEYQVTEAYADITKIPQYYTVTAQLYGGMGLPVGNEFFLTEYTESIRNLLKASTADFDADRVVSFTESEKTNFIVLSEETVYAESSDDKNVIVSADYDNNKFVIDSADETIKNLEKGDLLYIADDNENIVAVSVEKIKAKDDTVTITGNDEIDDMFAFVKIQTTSNGDGARIDMSKVDEDVELPDAPEGAEEFVLPENTPLRFNYNKKSIVPALKGEISFKGEKDLAILNKNNGDPDDDTDDGNLSITISGKLEVELLVHFYKSLDKKVEAGATLEVNFSYGVEASGKIEINKDLFGPIVIPTGIAGVNAEIQPRFVFEASGTVTLKAEYTPIFGFEYTTDNGSKLINEGGDDVIDLKAINIEAELKVGFEAELSLVLLNRKICYIGFPLRATLNLSMDSSEDDCVSFGKGINKQCGDAHNESYSVISLDNDEEMLHKCDLCLDFVPSIELSGSFEVSILGKSIYDFIEKDSLTITGTIDASNLSFHVSVYNGKPSFAFGDCEEYKYKAAIYVVNEENDGGLENAKVTLGGVEVYTDPYGRAIFFCDNGSYRAAITYGGKTTSIPFTIKNNQFSYTLKVKFKADDDGDPVVDDLNGVSGTGTAFVPATTTKRTTVTKKIVFFPDSETTPRVSRLESVKLGDNITGTIYSNGELQIVGSGDMYTNMTSSPFNKKSLVKTIIFDEPDADEGKYITSVGNNVFRGFSNLETVYMSDHIKIICTNAFSGCSSLKYFRYSADAVNTTFPLPASLETIASYAFSDCSKLTSVMIPGTVQTVGDYAFSGCSSLSSVVIADGVKKIGNYVFNLCTSLKDLTLPYAGHSKDIKATSDPLVDTLFDDRWRSYSSEYQAGTLSFGIPKSLTSITITGGTIIPDNSFRGMWSLKTLNIPNSITYVGAYAFKGCSGLSVFPITNKTVTIGADAYSGCKGAAYDSYKLPASVKTVGSGAFAECNSVQEFIVPGTVETLGDFAFSSSTGLKNVIIEDGVKQIGNYIFNLCSSLESITLPYAGNSIDLKAESPAISDMLFSDRWRSYSSEYQSGTLSFGTPKTLTSITITGGTVIPNNSFKGMHTLTNIDLADSIKIIGTSAFEGCTGLSSISVGSNGAAGNFVMTSSIEEIGAYAFSRCNGLEIITIPGTVKSIGDYAFNSCENLKKAVICDGVGYIGEYIFNLCTSIQSVTLPYAGHTPELEAASDPIVDTLFEDRWRSYSSEYQAGTLSFGIPKSLTSITITGGTIIPDNSFRGMWSLKTLNIPNSITYVGAYAFKGCSGLSVFPITNKTVTIGADAYSGCKGAAYDSYKLPASVKTVGSGAFAECNSVQEFIVPGTVETLGDFAFSSSTGLKNVVIEDGVKQIGNYIFNLCSSLESITIPYAGNSIDLKAESPAISDMLFSDRWRSYSSEYQSGTLSFGTPKTLTSITITGGTVIPNNSFRGMSSLTSIRLPNDTLTIGSSAFCGCTGLKNLTVTGENAGKAGVFVLPSKTEIIGGYAFDGCSGLTSITVPGTVKDLGGYAFNNCGNLTKAIISDGVGHIGNYIFNLCTSIQSVTLPYAGHSAELKASSDAIADTMFDDRWRSYSSEYQAGTLSFGIPKSLTSITITGGTIIPVNAFKGMWSITEITLPASLTDVSNSAFAGCTGLKDVYVTNGEADWEKVSIGTNNDPLLNALKHYNAIKILTQPTDLSVDEGARVRFSVDAVGCGLKYQWQYSTDKGKTWKDMENVTGPSCSFNVRAQQSGYLYRCVITSKFNEKAESEGAALTVSAVEPAYVSGDANGDGVIDENDVTTFIGWLLGAEGAEISNWEALDLCKDGVIDVFDLVMLRKLIAGTAPAPKGCPEIIEPEYTEEEQTITEETEEVQTTEEEMTEEIEETEETEESAESETETSEEETEVIETVETIENIEIIEPEVISE